MISYLIYSTICMGFVLLFYHAVLASEKTYQINRWYLLAGLLFSLVVPVMPVGIADSLLNFGSNAEIFQITSTGIEGTNAESARRVTGSSTEINSAEDTPSFGWIYSLLLWSYSIITLFLFLRMIRHLYRMQLKTMKNPATSFNGHKVVLVDEETVPHTFWKTIFVNREQYENDEINEEVMIHELIHARQNHTFDILITEILKTICWFNPLLYFYKTAIQVNHEYIADDKVLSNGADIANYQALLLKMRTAESAHYLSTSLNFNITKKRFKMMTLNDNSTYCSSLKIASIIPFFLILCLSFGCEPASMEKDNQIKRINVEIIDAETIKLDGKTVSAAKFGATFSELSMDPEQTLVDIKLHTNAPVELLTDVQDVLRENGALKINYSTEQSNANETEEIQSANIDERNILHLHINEAGDIFINEERTSLSSVNNVVTEFITNNGESNHLSESPKDAVIAISTDKQTPYDTYRNAMEEVNKVYDELKNQVSLKLFDKPFQSLEERSAEKNKVEDMYPKKISIKEPSNS